MELNIRPLTEACLADYFNYFDNVAFKDHVEWSGCYCTYYYFDSVTEIEVSKITVSGMRERAKKFIRDGKLTGYLAYEGDQVVGWCNAGPRNGYERLMEGHDICRTDDEKKIPVKAIVCFSVAPSHRGRGVASALLAHVCKVTKADDYEWIEAYPRRDLVTI